MKEDKHHISIRVNGKVCEPREVVTKKDEHIIPPPQDNVIDFVKVKEERKSLREPFWDDGNREKSPKLPFNRKRKPFPFNQNKKLPFMLIAALCSAIVIGLALGFIVLSIFTGQATERAGEEEIMEVPALFTGNAQIGFPLLEVEVIQGGAFSSVEKGSEVVNAIKNDNGAAVLLNVDSDEPTFMIIGVSNNRDQAEQLRSVYEQKGYETYVKTYVIDGQVVNGQTMEAYTWFEDLFANYYTLMDITAAHVSGEETDNAEKLKQVDASLSSLQTDEARLMTMSDEVKKEAEALLESLQNAVYELSQGEEGALWRTEQQLLNALSIYEQLINIAK